MADSVTPETPNPEPVAAAPQADQYAPPSTPAPAPEPAWDAKASFERLEQMLYTLARQIPQQQAPAPEKKEMSKAELWALAQQGNQQAFEMYQEQIASDLFTKRFGQVQQTQNIGNQLAVLAQKYPELADMNHPLTQRAMAFKQALVQMGHDANAPSTTLDAVLRAVADSRDIIAPRAPAMPARAASASGHIAPSHQGSPSRQAPAEQITPDEAALAKRMGIKDPAKAKSRFNDRQVNGTSSVSPTIIAALDVVERQGNVR